VDELLEQWSDPVFNEPHRNVPVSLAGRLTEMADEITAGENVAEAVANARIPDAPDDLGVAPLRIGALPTGVRIFYERMHALLAVAATARSTKPAKFSLQNPPSDVEKRFGSALGQAFHQGCSLADVALAAALPEERIVAIGKRTIKRSAWLDHL
jgi:hypothetical protein